MTERLKSIVNADTPAAVEVPQTWPAFAVWAVTRFGVGVLMVGLVAIATKQVYTDALATQQQLMRYVIERSEVEAKRAVADAKLADALTALSESIDRIDTEAREAHRKTAAAKQP